MTTLQELVLAQLRGEEPATANPNLMRQGARGRASALNRPDEFIPPPAFLREPPASTALPIEGRATFLPFQDKPGGGREWAVPGFAAGMVNAATAPGRVYRGEDVGPDEAFNVAGAAMTGSLPLAPASLGGTLGTMTRGRTKTNPLVDTVLERLRQGEGRTGDVATVMGGIQEQNLSPQVLAKRDAMMKESPAFSEAAPFLQPVQMEKATKVPSKSVEIYNRDWPTLPPTDEVALIARAGGQNRGWYRDSRGVIRAMFPEAPVEQTRFGKGMAALSPQTSVESNAANTVPTYFDWKAKGSPLDEESIHRILAENVQSQPTVALGAETQRPAGSLRAIAKALGAPPEVVAGNPQLLRLAISVYEQSGPTAAMEVLKGSVLDAWKGNFIRAMRDEPVLSGPKVNSFGTNLDPQNPFAGLHITQDTWDAMMKGWLQKEKYGGQGFNAARGDPGYGPGYTMGSAKTAAAADRLGWLPEEVQETTWSWTKPVGEGKSGVIVPKEVAQGVPDFQSLLLTPELMRKMPPDVRARLENYTPRPRGGAEFAPTAAEHETLLGAQRRVQQIQQLRRDIKAGIE